MNLLKPDVIYLILLLVVPGLISQSVFNAMVAKGKNRQLDLYQSIAHSVVVFTGVYSIAVLFFGAARMNAHTMESLIHDYRWAPLGIALIMGIASILWGVLYAKIYRSKLLKKFLRKFGDAVEPPNVYAALLVEKYWDEEDRDVRFWLTYKNGHVGYIEGCVEMAAVEEHPREVYLTRVAYLDSNRKEIYRLPENQGIILKIDDLDLVEITIVEGVKDKKDHHD